MPYLGHLLDSAKEFLSSIRIRWIFRLFAVALGLAKTVVFLNGTVDSDTISYFDIAHAYLRHDWSMAINGYWGPLYSWLLAATFGVLKPVLRMELPTAHILNFVVFIACIAAFEFFWGNLIRLRQVTLSKVDEPPAVLSTEVMWILGYSLFLWLVIDFLLFYLKPDLLVMTIVLLQAGLSLRLQSDTNPTWLHFVAFGAALGVGYLTKSILLPTAFIFLGALLLVRHSKRFVARLAVAVLVFFAISGPAIAALSHSKHRFTFGDTGKLNYIFFNYNLRVDWRGQPEGTGIPVHPVQIIHQHPTITLTSGPWQATYPVQYDPSYWVEGMSHRFEFLPVLRNFLRCTRDLLRFLLLPKVFLVGFALILIGASWKQSVRSVLQYLPLLLPSLAACGMYSLTLIEPRYIVPWEMVLWSAILAGVCLRKRAASSYPYLLIALTVAALLMSSVGREIHRVATHGSEQDATKDYLTAEGLQNIGLAAGTKVAAIGFDYQITWAYLARLSIVATVDTKQTCEFWRASRVEQDEMFHAFKRAGADAVVVNAGGAMMIRTADGSPPLDLSFCSRPSEGWQKIGNTLNYVYLLRR